MEEENKKVDWVEEFRKIKQHLFKDTSFNPAVIDRIKLIVE